MLLLLAVNMCFCWDISKWLWNIMMKWNFIRCKGRGCLVCWHLLVQSQQWKYQNCVLYVPKDNDKDTRKRHLRRSGVFTVNLGQFFWCFQGWLWTSKWWLGGIFFWRRVFSCMKKIQGFFLGGGDGGGAVFCGFFVLSLKRSVFNSNGFKIVLAVADSKVYFCVF